jgi:two-component system, response regulator
MRLSERGILVNATLRGNLASTPPTETDLDSPLSQTPLLIVEDDPDDFLLLERALKKIDSKAQICWAKSGAEAIGALSRLSSQFSNICLVVDVQLRDMNGFDLVDNLKANDLCHDVILVFLTGNSNPALRTRAFACGADAFLLKPCDDSDFSEIAHELNERCRRVGAQTQSTSVQAVPPCASTISGFSP